MLYWYSEELVNVNCGSDWLMSSSVYHNEILELEINLYLERFTEDRKDNT